MRKMGAPSKNCENFSQSMVALDMSSLRSERNLKMNQVGKKCLSIFAEKSRTRLK